MDNDSQKDNEKGKIRFQLPKGIYGCTESLLFLIGAIEKIYKGFSGLRQIFLLTS